MTLLPPTSITIEIPGEPVAQGRPRAFRRGKHVGVYDPPKSRNWKATAQGHMKEAMEQHGRAIQPFIGPVYAQVTALFSCPRSQYRKRNPRGRRWHAKRPDAENVAKAVLDAATGILWHDDDQVARLVVRKVIARQGEAPGVWLKVGLLEEPPVEVP